MQNIEALAILTLMKEELLHNLEHDFPVAKARLKDRFGLDLSTCDNLFDIEHACIEGKCISITVFGKTQNWFDILSFDVIHSGATASGLFSINVFCQWKYKGKVYGMNQTLAQESVVFLPESSLATFQQALTAERNRGRRSKSREKKALQIVKNLMSSST